MITGLKIVIGILLVFTAIGLACAVRLSLRRGPDPFARPFGDVPGFSAEQLRAISGTPHPRDPLRRSFTHDHFNSAGLALRPDAGGEGFLSSPRPVAARNSSPAELRDISMPSRFARGVWWWCRHG